MIQNDAVIYIREVAPDEIGCRWTGRNSISPEQACRDVAQSSGLNVIECVVESDTASNKALIELIQWNLKGKDYDEIIYPFTLVILEWSMLSRHLKDILYDSVISLVIAEEVINKLFNLDELTVPVCPLLRPDRLGAAALYPASAGTGGCQYFGRKLSGEVNVDLGEVWSRCIIRHEGGICPADADVQRLLSEADVGHMSLVESNRHLLAKNCIATHRRLTRSVQPKRDDYSKAVIAYRLKALREAVRIATEEGVVNLKDLFRKLTDAGYYTTDPALGRKKLTPFTHGEFKRLLDYLREKDPAGLEHALQGANGKPLPWE